MGRNTEQLVYLMLNARNGYIKIGISDNPYFREKTLQSEEPEVVLLATAEGGRNFEGALHRFFAAKRIRGEWFNLSSNDYSVLLTHSGFSLDTRNLEYSEAILLGVTLEKLALIQSARNSFEMCATEEIMEEVGVGGYWNE